LDTPDTQHNIAICQNLKSSKMSVKSAANISEVSLMMFLWWALHYETQPKQVLWHHSHTDWRRSLW